MRREATEVCRLAQRPGRTSPPAAALRFYLHWVRGHGQGQLSHPQRQPQKRFKMDRTQMSAFRRAARPLAMGVLAMLGLGPIGWGCSSQTRGPGGVAGEQDSSQSRPANPVSPAELRGPAVGHLTWDLLVETQAANGKLTLYISTPEGRSLAATLPLPDRIPGPIRGALETAEGTGTIDATLAFIEGSKVKYQLTGNLSWAGEPYELLVRSVDLVADRLPFVPDSPLPPASILFDNPREAWMLAPTVAFEEDGTDLYRMQQPERQWRQVAHLSGISGSLARGGSYLFAATSTDLYRSDDGGQNFEPIGPLRADPFSLIDFVDARHGVVFETKLGVIHFTHDGGSTWSSYDLEYPEHLAALADGAVKVFDPEHAMVLGEGVLWFTDDGGTRWMSRPIEPEGLLSGPAARVAGAAFNRPDDGWILSEGALMHVSESEQVVVVRSELLPEPLPGTQPAAPSMPVLSGFMAATQDGALWLVGEGGAARALPTLAYELVTSPCQEYRQLAASDANHAVVLCGEGGGSSTVWVTGDGGQHWSHSEGAMEQPHQVFLAPDGTGMLFGESQVQGTTDHGAVWTTKSSLLGYRSDCRLVLPNARLCDGILTDAQGGETVVFVPKYPHPSGGTVKVSRDGSAIWLEVEGAWMFRFTDQPWRPAPSGTFDVAMTDAYLYASGYPPIDDELGAPGGHRLWRRPRNVGSWELVAEETPEPPICGAGEHLWIPSYELDDNPFGSGEPSHLYRWSDHRDPVPVEGSDAYGDSVSHCDGEGAITGPGDPMLVTEDGVRPLEGMRIISGGSFSTIKIPHRTRYPERIWMGDLDEHSGGELLVIWYLDEEAYPRFDGLGVLFPEDGTPRADGSVQGSGPHTAQPMFASPRAPSAISPGSSKYFTRL